MFWVVTIGLFGFMYHLFKEIQILKENKLLTNSLQLLLCPKTLPDFKFKFTVLKPGIQLLYDIRSVTAP